MCMTSEAPVDYANQERAAELAQAVEEDWYERFQPWEQELAGNILNQNEQIADQVSEAQVDAQKSYEASLATAERNTARYGGQMDADQQAANEKSQSLQSQGSQIGAMGNTRDSEINRYDELTQSMVNIGRGVQSQGISGIEQGVGLESQRNQAAISSTAQSNASKTQAAGTVAGLAAYAMISDKSTKTNIRRASKKRALKDIESVKLKKWDYKPGLSGGRELTGHIGGMAQDMPDSMTTADHKKVEIGDSIMTLVGATQELSQRIGMLERDHGTGR